MSIDTQALIEEMAGLIAKIKDGSATQGELEAFAAAAAQVHERAVILRYKSYEAKVFGTPQAPVSEPVAETEVVEEQVTTEAAIETGEPDIAMPAVDDFSAEEPETAAEPEGFDLFSMGEPEDDEPAFDPFAETPEPEETPEPVAEVEEPAYSEPEETPEPEAEWQEEEPIEELVAATPEEPATIEDTENEEAHSSARHPLYDRLHLPDDSLASRLMSVRLDTLKGAFGFNERVQIVQELFQGSNEQYSEAIEKLDALDSKDEARAIVSDYANRFSWSERSDLVMEFARKVERRYA